MSHPDRSFLLPAAEAVALVARRHAEGWRVFELPRGIDGKAAFFDAIRATLPLDPPLTAAAPPNWDALADSLWSGLDTLDDARIAIFWPDAQAMADAAPHDAEIATEILDELAVSLADPETTAGSTKEVVIIRSR